MMAVGGRQSRGGGGYRGSGRRRRFCLRLDKPAGHTRKRLKNGRRRRKSPCVPKRRHGHHVVAAIIIVVIIILAAGFQQHINTNQQLQTDDLQVVRESHRVVHGK